MYENDRLRNLDRDRGTGVIASCTWDAPGADRYTGTVPAAIAAYGFPIATQAALIDAFERRNFTDSVVIDRDSIRGKNHVYDPSIRSMHFGHAGRICADVERSGWSFQHVETALVVCAGGECIAWPAVCGNVFRLTRKEGAGAEPRALAEPVGVPAASLAGTPDLRLLGMPPEPVASMRFELPAEPPGAGQAGAAPVFFAWPAPPLVAYGPVLYLPVAAVAEPESYALLIVGLMAVAACRWSRK